MASERIRSHRSMPCDQFEMRWRYYKMPILLFSAHRTTVDREIDIKYKIIPYFGWISTKKSLDWNGTYLQSTTWSSLGANTSNLMSPQWQLPEYFINALMLKALLNIFILWYKFLLQLLVVHLTNKQLSLLHVYSAHENNLVFDDQTKISQFHSTILLNHRLFREKTKNHTSRHIASYLEHVKCVQAHVFYAWRWCMLAIRKTDKLHLNLLCSPSVNLKWLTSHKYFYPFLKKSWTRQCEMSHFNMHTKYTKMYINWPFNFSLTLLWCTLL